jgi:hypothetical protein
MSADTHAHEVLDVRVGARALRLPAGDVATALAFVLPFAAILYLGLAGGGYDPVVRGQVGIVFWWLLLVGALAGAIPVGLSRRPLVAVAMLSSFLAWTALAVLWTDSDERTVLEVGRVGLYLAVLLTGTSLVARGRARAVVTGVATAIVVIAAFGVASRLHPGWFPGDDAAQQLGDARRLAYPVNYWNGLAALAGLGIPLLLAMCRSTSLIARSLCAAALPLLGTCILLTQSRAGLVAAMLGVGVFVALAADRLPTVATAMLAVGGTLIVHAAVQARPEVSSGLTSADGYPGSEVLVVLLIVMAGTGFVQWGISLADRHAGRPAIRAVPRPAVAVVLAVAVAAVVIAGTLGDTISDGWESFKTPNTFVEGDSTFDRLSSVSGEGRYQMWSAAVDAQQTKPLTGRGPGTYEYWWARSGDLDGIFVRDAHSLYFQTLAELGIVGLLVLAAFFLYVLGCAVATARRAVGERRTLQAACAAALLVFIAEAAVDWIWQLAVVPIAMLFLAAAALTDERAESARAQWRLRIPTIASAGLVLLVLTVGIGGVSAVAESQQAAEHGDLARAAELAGTAIRAQPYAATPRLQAALVLEQGGRLAEAAAAAHAATDREPVNWRAWAIRARIATESGDVGDALEFFRRARALNPRSPIFEAEQ